MPLPVCLPRERTIVSWSIIFRLELDGSGLQRVVVSYVVRDVVDQSQTVQSTVEFLVTLSETVESVIDKAKAILCEREGIFCEPSSSSSSNSSSEESSSSSSSEESSSSSA